MNINIQGTLKLITKITDKGTIYQCSCCGEEYDELPLTFGNDFPDYAYSIPPDEWDTRIEKQESLCVVDGQHFFHRGRLTIPINNHADDLIFNVWTSISDDNFRKRNDLWSDPDRIKEDPYFGWLQTNVPTYGNTLNIKTIAIENEVGFIPAIKMIEEKHPLTIDQQEGISFDKALEIVGVILASGHSA